MAEIDSNDNGSRMPISDEETVVIQMEAAENQILNPQNVGNESLLTLSLSSPTLQQNLNSFADGGPLSLSMNAIQNPPQYRPLLPHPAAKNLLPSATQAPIPHPAMEIKNPALYRALHSHPEMEDENTPQYGTPVPYPRGENQSEGEYGAIRRRVHHKKQVAPIPVAADAVVMQQRRVRNAPVVVKDADIVPPYPWATNQRATVYTLEHLLSRGITTISGDMECKRCARYCVWYYDLQERFRALETYIKENKANMHHRAPEIWKTPTLPGCFFCNELNCLRPVITVKKRDINWLFLLLSQMLGLCTLNQLKYFCKHTKNHRTGAKDRLLYLVYFSLCLQLSPTGPFRV